MAWVWKWGIQESLQEDLHGENRRFIQRVDWKGLSVEVIFELGLSEVNKS